MLSLRALQISSYSPGTQWCGLVCSAGSHQEKILHQHLVADCLDFFNLNIYHFFIHWCVKRMTQVQNQV